MANNQGGKAVILLYHQVGKNPTEQTNLDCFCDLNRFEEQMSFLNDSEHKVIELDELLDKISSAVEVFDENYVVLTFDDGCDKFSKTALPILQKYNFPSTIYPVAGCLGQVASWPKVVNPDLKIVSELALKQLSDKGVNIGAHTMNHLKLSTLDISIAREEISKSKKLLGQVISKEITSFSYPHGDLNSESKSLVKSLGFKSAVTCKSGYIKPNEDLLDLPRKYVTYFDTLATFKNILAHE
jgi:peptidoglycan/xylan/chitin deacetylase (PgdA/CDA1 family)